MVARKVLVLGSDTRSFLGVIRSLGRAGIEVHATWAPRWDPALCSRFIQKYHALPTPDEASDWPEELCRLLRAESFSLLLPTNDPSILPLRAERARLEALAPIYLVNEEAHEIASSKELTHDLAVRLGIPVAKARRLTTLSDSEALESLSLPVVLRPCSSFSLQRLSERRNVVKVYEREAVSRVIEAMLKAGPLLLEENFVGVGVGIEILCEHGKILTCFAHERVHEPLHGGGSSYRKSIEPHPDMLAAVRKIAAETNYHGLGMFEFKYNKSSGEWILIEINPRFWGSLPLAISCGADFPLFLFRMLIDGKTDFPDSFELGRFCRHPTLDLDWMSANFAADKKDPTLCAKPWMEVVKEVSNVLMGRERFDTLTFDDPLPGLVDLSRWTSRKMRTFCSRFKQKTLQLKISRWLLQKKARAALQDAQSVLFLCYGNICRSPFAEKLAGQARPDLQVSSAGFIAKEGRGSPAQAREAGKKYGVDLSLHKSKLVTRESLEKADAIFVFDPQNVSLVKSLNPAEVRKTFYLGALNANGPLYIDDPYLSGQDTFDRVYSEIANAVCLGFLHKP